MTQDKHIEKDMVTLWQNSIAQIDTSNLQPASQEQRQSSKFSQIPSMIQSKLSKSVTYNLTQCSFQLLVKKQNDRQKKKPEPQNQQQNIDSSFQNRFYVDDNKRISHIIPKKYRSISSQYSPTGLQQYLNQKESNLSVNKKWLQVSPRGQSHSIQLRVQAQLDNSLVKQNFKDRCRTTTGCLANKHLFLTQKIQNVQKLDS
ncbi:unnamed protein product (macronuclear) [Paramecium tetraurelia]|uniref:Uncharacterized protein n=1 Tax=Paramecium tetraurelia TaxID=5888 RepID=A0D0D7_PARTE|nr:uncharacterized protein GSPATT00012056001 [Paramecium tetraurelia]CAK76504.1 unnamed protein product [Paramecium tetraurelia]|eukprot:XP_001443901.1 hypothetical protein (macronuclear) [Paramecium tetraurelia strain d4-2]